MLSDDVQSLAPFPLVRVAGEAVLQSWEELQTRPGVVPLMLGNQDATEFVLQEVARDTRTVEEVLQAAAGVDLDAWMAERVRECPGIFDVSAIDQPWDGVVRPIAPFIPAHDHRGNPYPEVFFALVPVREPWHVSAHLRTRGWGSCPDAPVHVAALRRWYERYGARMTTLSDGVVELAVSRPPATLEDARVLALEHFIYCPDVIHQGMRSLGNLAGALQNSPRWYFWWALEAQEP